MTDPRCLRMSQLTLGLMAALAAVPAVHAQSTEDDSTGSSRVTASSTSNTTAAYDTKRVQQLDKISVTANKDAYILGGGNMTVQTASKAISTMTREAITKASGGSNFTQLIGSIPGVDVSTDDVTGLANGNYSLRGFDSSAVGITVNGAPITDSGSYSVYATEYGDSENYNDITVLQGTPNVDAPEMGATGGQIAWSTIDPSHDFGVDFNQAIGSNDYRRTFLRVNTGDTGPVRSWLSISKNTADKWKGRGDMDVLKVDGKSVWDINPGNSISASFQYNRQENYSYYTQSKSTIAKNYEADFNETWGGGTTSSDGSYWGVRANPYESVLASLDGEFTLSDSLRLSVVPYLWWGDGGGYSSGTVVGESSDTSVNTYGKSVDGYTGYAARYSGSSTTRPGVVVKFFQDIGMDHNLVYGLWYDRARKSQQYYLVKVNQETGQLCDIWADSDGCKLYYADGTQQWYRRTYTVTTTQKYFVQDNWTPTDDLTINLGLSFLHSEREGHHYMYPGSTREYGVPSFEASYNKLLPAFGLKYQIDELNQLFLGVAKSFRVPATDAIYTNDYAGEAQAEPETAWTYDLGWRFYGDRLGASLMAYQSNYENKSMSSYTQDGDSVYTTIPKVRMRGFNGEASYRLTESLKLYASYTRTEAEVMSPYLNYCTGGTCYDYAVSGKQLANTPKDLATVSLSYEQSGFWASLNARYSGSRYGDYMNTEEVGGYTTVGLNAGYNFQDWSWLKKPYVKLNVSNLTDRKAITWAGSTTIQSVAADGLPSTGTAYYSVLQPRAFVFTVGASF